MSVTVSFATDFFKRFKLRILNFNHLRDSFKVLQSIRYGVAGQRVAKRVTEERNQGAGVVLHIVSASNRKINLKL